MCIRDRFLFRPIENFNRLNISANRLAMPELPEAIFMEDSNSSITSVRQNLQTFYVRRLLKILSLEYYDEISSAAAYNSLRKIEKIVNRKGRDIETESHRQFIACIIKSRLDKNR